MYMLETAGNQDRHNGLKKFDIWLNQTAVFEVTWP